jgi:hypothetical protein
MGEFPGRLLYPEDYDYHKPHLLTDFEFVKPLQIADMIVLIKQSFRGFNDLKLEDYFVTDPKVLEYRLQIVEDVVTYSSLYGMFQKSIPMIQNIVDMRRVMDNNYSVESSLTAIRYLETYQEHQHVEPSSELTRCIQFLLQKNILCGDALTMLQQDGQPITFCEWTFIGTSGKVKRRDFELSELLKNVEYDKPKAGEEGLLFADTGEPTFVHLPKREYPITDYLKLPDYE